MPGKRSSRKGFARASRRLCAAEALEPRRMLTLIVFDGTSGDDTITLDTHVTVTGVFPHFMVHQFVDFTLNAIPTVSQEVTSGDQVSVQTLGGNDTVNI